MLAYVGVILISFLIAGLWTRYIAATAQEKAKTAAIYDLLLMLSSSSIFQIWAVQNNSFALLIVGDLAAALGTYCFIRWAKTNRNTKRTPKKAK